jgi:molybdate transport system permease protein
MRVRATSPLPWLAGLLLLYLLAPILAFVVRLAGGASSPEGLGPALATSLLTATVSAAIVTVLGVPLAYLLARSRAAGARLLTVLVALPLALPPLMSGLLLLYIVGPYTVVGKLFGGGLTDTRAGIVLAQTFVAAPFLVIAARAAFVSVDPVLEEVAASLGHGPLARFRCVAVPAALPGIAAGVMLAWLRSFGEFGATIILAYHPYSLPVFTFAQFDATGLPATMVPIAAALAAALAVLVVAQLPTPRRRRPRVAQTAPQAATLREPAPIDFALLKELDGFSLDVCHRAGGPRLALLGPSGAGKTLTLRLLAGLTPAGPGSHVRVGRRALHRVPPERRAIGYVPQRPALLPRRTVWRQVTFGAGANPALASWWIERLGLGGLEDRYPDELSGGQQKRVSLARALAVEPQVLLLDEPFTGLDAPVRRRLSRELRRLQREAALSTVVVTHDPEEAAVLGDEIMVLERGRVLQAGPREQVFHAPCSPRVAALLGAVNTHRGRVAAPGVLASAGTQIQACTQGLSEGSDVVWCIRPEQIRLDPYGPYSAVVGDCIDLGAVRELALTVEGTLELTVHTIGRPTLETGQPLRVELDPDDIRVWPTAHVEVDHAAMVG